MTLGASPTTRRTWLRNTLTTLASGVAASALTEETAVAAPIGTHPVPHALTPGAPARASVPELEPAHAWTLLSPFTEGATIGSWRIERFLSVRRGVVGLLMSDRTGAVFQLDLCARDPSPNALRPPASTEHYDVYLSNGGAGSTPSLEDHGLAAMAIADAIRNNEARLVHSGFVTLRERLAGDAPA